MADEYVQLDDGWTAVGPGGPNSGPGPRDAAGRIVPDKAKFPNGMKEVADYIHGKGLKLGIYTAPHGMTCAGFTGSLHNEAVDAQTFADWGVDFVKYDAGCQDDASLHDGTLLASIERMRDGLNAVSSAQK